MTESDAAMNSYVQWKTGREAQGLTWRDYLSDFGVSAESEENEPDARIVGIDKFDYEFFTYEKRSSKLFPGADSKSGSVAVIELSLFKKDAGRRDDEFLAFQAWDFQPFDESQRGGDKDLYARFDDFCAARRGIIHSLASEVLLPKGYAFSQPSKEYPFGFFFKTCRTAEDVFDSMSVRKPLWNILRAYEAELFFPTKISAGEAFLKEKAEERKRDKEKGFCVSEWSSKKTGKVFDNIDFSEREPSADETEFLLGAGFRKGYRDGGKSYFSKERIGGVSIAETVAGLNDLQSRAGNRIDIDKDIDMEDKEILEQTETAVFDNEGASVQIDAAETNASIDDDVFFDDFETAEKAAEAERDGPAEQKKISRLRDPRLWTAAAERDGPAEQKQEPENSAGSVQHWQLVSEKGTTDFVSFSTAEETERMEGFMQERGYKKSRNPTRKHPHGCFWAPFDKNAAEVLDAEIDAARAGRLAIPKTERAAAAETGVPGGLSGKVSDWKYHNKHFVSFGTAEETAAAEEFLLSNGYVRAVGADGEPKTTAKNPNGWYVADIRDKFEEERAAMVVQKLSGKAAAERGQAREAAGQQDEKEQSESLDMREWVYEGRRQKFANVGFGSPEITEAAKDFLTDNGFKFNQKGTPEFPYGFFYRPAGSFENEAGARAALKEFASSVFPALASAAVGRQTEKVQKQFAAEQTKEKETGMSFETFENVDVRGHHWTNVYVTGNLPQPARNHLRSLGFWAEGTYAAPKLSVMGNTRLGKITDTPEQHAQLEEGLAYLRAYQRPDAMNEQKLGETREKPAAETVSAKLATRIQRSDGTPWLNVFFSQDPGIDAKQTMSSLGMVFCGKGGARWYQKETPELKKDVGNALDRLGIPYLEIAPNAGKQEKLGAAVSADSPSVKFSHDFKVLENGNYASFFSFSDKPRGGVPAALKNAGYTFVGSRTLKSDGSFVASCWHKTGGDKDEAESLKARFSETMTPASKEEVEKIQLAAAGQKPLQIKKTRGRGM